MTTREIHASLIRALAKMKESLSFPDTEPMREATIQRFEYTFELSWKLMSSILKDQGNETFGVKNIIRDSARLGLLDNVDRWFEFLLARNKTSNIYKEEVAEEVYLVAKSDFVEYVDSLLKNASMYVTPST